MVPKAVYYSDFPNRHATAMVWFSPGISRECHHWTTAEWTVQIASLVEIVLCDSGDREKNMFALYITSLVIKWDSWTIFSDHH